MPRATSDRATNAGVVVLLLLFSAFTVLPLIWMVFTSFKPLQEVEGQNLLPTHWQPENYSQVFTSVPFARYYMNSVFIAAWVTFLTCLTSAMSAYAFARLEWRFRDAVFKMYLATMMIPGVVTMIPNYTLMVRLHLLDSFTGLIVPSAFGAFGTFLLRQFMLTIPTALDEAATIDGAGPLNVFLDVVLPLARPGLIALAIFTFLGTYGSFYWPLVLVKSEQLRTLPIGMMYFDTAYDRQTNLLMAASLMSLLPPIALFLVGQKYLVRGIALGAVKG
ncbi:MAG TPA: carbohydrate ABC transporter permease [Fimbriimonas sp.]|nr:carbohydrate ABC transporter permease [Fimbriimonas sp.]